MGPKVGGTRVPTEIHARDMPEYQVSHSWHLSRKGGNLLLAQWNPHQRIRLLLLLSLFGSHEGEYLCVNSINIDCKIGKIVDRLSALPAGFRSAKPIPMQFECVEPYTASWSLSAFWLSNTISVK